VRKATLLFLLLVPALTFGQSAIVSINTHSCVWHAGDDIRWAAPALDESGWQSYFPRFLQLRDPYFWVRCHADLSSLHGLARPVIQVNFISDYQLFVDGQPVGGAGSLRTGDYSLDVIRSFPMPAELSRNAVIAFRVTYRFMPSSNPGSLPLLAVQAGEESALRDRRAAIVLAQSSANLTTAIYDGVVGVFGLVLLGLYFNDRSRRELLLLSLNCLGLATIFLNLEAARALAHYSAVLFALIYALATVITGVAQPWFFFRLAGRRVPLLFWILIGVACLDHALWAPAAVVPLAQSLQLGDFYERWAAQAGFVARVLTAFAPFVAFWPYARISRRVRPLAILCMVWGADQVLYFMVRLSIFHVLGMPDLSPRWGMLMSATEPIATLFVVATLMGLLFREQRQVADERAEMAGELQAARRVQQYLIPEQLPETPGLMIASVYHPAREVGGDFFQVLPQTDRSVLIVVGDVAGHGMESGMLASLIVGAVRTAAEFTCEPERILALLNKRLQGRGLVTCQALRIASDGAATLANAGHLPPYLNGNEMAIEGSLPLGAVPEIEFPSLHFSLASADQLMLMTDGIAEAQDAQGHLFGFEHIGEMLRNGMNPAALAKAAQAFGQEDDITVLTVERMATAV